MHATEYPFVKIFSMTKSKPKGLDQYYRELTSLGDRLYEILDQGKQWSNEVALALSSGGGAIFPHTFFSKCGEQIGAVIHAILDSGADQVIVLGTVHPFPQLLQARIKEFNDEDISQEPSWGVLNPESVNAKALLKDEFSLNLFKSLFKIEVERRGKKAPRLIERYPSLVNRHPEALPGMPELKEFAKSAVIVGTEDYCHHGIAYALPKNYTMPMGEHALSFAQNQIEQGFSLLEQNQYAEFYKHGMHLNALGDPSDVSATMHYLVGSHAKPKILNLKLVDVSHLFENDPSPSWVAATLATITKD
jgi:hypothetical protein